MDLSSEAAEIHMRTDAKNLLTTARTIHLLEQKETVHMISGLRKKACSRSIHDLAHITIESCLADCLTKSSATADNLITLLNTGRLLEVDVHPNFRTLIWSTRPSCLHGVEHSCTQGRKNVSFLNAIKISVSPAPREGPSHAMFVRTSTDSESQDATKITSALSIHS